MEEVYTLWIVPPQDVKGKLQIIVDELSRKYDGPIFEPHMTLLGNVGMKKDELVRKVEELKNNVNPFSVALGEVSFSSTYFQNVFVQVRSSSSLVDLNWRAKKILDMKNDVFMPHISLLYGEHDAETRERAMQDVKLDDGLEFSAKSLVITPATSDPSTWEHLAKIPFR